MKIRVTVHPNSKQNQMTHLRDNLFKAQLTAIPKNNQANFALIELVADHFNVHKNQVFFCKGYKSRTKTLEIIKK